MSGCKQSDLVELFGVSSKQSLSNKFSGERWSAEDLIKLAEFTGCKLAFILPDGERIILDQDTRGGSAGVVPGPGESSE